MENSFQTSFIPKKPISPTSSISKSPTSLFSILLVALLIIMSTASAGLFLYKNYLISQEKVLASSLAKVSGSFQQDTIADLELFDKRSSVAKQILSSHIVLSPLFALLGDLTIPAIQYTKFDHEMNDKGFVVQLSGTARDYKSIALQADAFNTAAGRSFKNVVFSNLTKDARGNVLFDVEFTVDPTLLSYQKNVLLEDSDDATQKTTDTAPVTTTNTPLAPTSPVTSAITPPATTTPTTTVPTTPTTTPTNPTTTGTVGAPSNPPAGAQ